MQQQQKPFWINFKSLKYRVKARERLQELEEETDNLHSIQPDPVSENMDAASSSSSSCTAPTFWR